MLGSGQMLYLLNVMSSHPQFTKSITSLCTIIATKEAAKNYFFILHANSSYDELVDVFISIMSSH